MGDLLGCLDTDPDAVGVELKGVWVNTPVPMGVCEGLREDEGVPDQALEREGQGVALRERLEVAVLLGHWDPRGEREFLRVEVGCREGEVERDWVLVLHFDTLTIPLPLPPPGDREGDLEAEEVRHRVGEELRVGSRGVGEDKGVADTLGVVLGHPECKGLLVGDREARALLEKEGLEEMLRVGPGDLLGAVEAVELCGVEEEERVEEGVAVSLWEGRGERDPEGDLRGLPDTDVLAETLPLPVGSKLVPEGQGLELRVPPKPGSKEGLSVGLLVESCGEEEGEREEDTEELGQREARGERVSEMDIRALPDPEVLAVVLPLPVGSLTVPEGVAEGEGEVLGHMEAEGLGVGDSELLGVREVVGVPV